MSLSSTDQRAKIKNKRYGVVNMGTSSMVVLLMGMSFTVIAALALSSAQNDYKLSQKLAEHTSDYYRASNEAYEKIAAGNEENIFDIKMNEFQELHVEYTSMGDKFEITCWRVTNVDQWEEEELLPVMK